MIPLLLLLIFANLSPFAMYTSVEHIPVGSSAGLKRTVVMIISPCLAIFILRETVSGLKRVPIIVCAVGTVFMCHGLVSQVSVQSNIDGTNMDKYVSHPIHSNKTSSRNDTVDTFNTSIDSTSVATIDSSHTNYMSSFLYGISLCIIGGMSSSIHNVLTKSLVDKVKDIMILSFFVSVIGVVLSITLMCIFEMEDINFPINNNKIIYLFVHAVLSGAESFTKSAAIYYGSSLIVAIVWNAEIPLKMICQHLLFSNLQPIKSSVSDIIGASVITLGISISCLLETAHFWNNSDSEIEQEEKKSEREKLLSDNDKEEPYSTK